MLCQLRTIRGSETGELDENLLRLLSECNIQMNCCCQTHPMEVMTRIEQVFIDLNLVKSLKKNKMVEVIHKGKTTTWMTSIAKPILRELNPTIKDWSTVPPLYNIWIYYRSQIKDIILEFGISHLPRYSRLPIVSASPIYGVPRILRCTGGLSPGVMYLLSSIARELFTEHSDRLSRVTPAVSL
jgi:hypothetical protein